MTSRNDETILNIPAPVLRFVPIDALFPHEEHDPQRSAPLTQRIAAADSWLHPPIVTPFDTDDDHYVVLDGANRCFAVKELGYPHILVQVVDYDSGQVKLDTWNHVLTKANTQRILQDMYQLPHIEMAEADLLEAKAELAQRDAIAYFLDFDNNQQVHMIATDERTMRDRTEKLRMIVDCYKHACTLDRINTEDPEQVLALYPKANGLMVFPHYEASEILFAAREHILLPPGISRHIIEGRAMRVMYPLEALKNMEESIEEKNAKLQQWLEDKIANRALRFYAESSFMFDD